jgi:TonB-linked SusC/RagA family outer membrane protein
MTYGQRTVSGKVTDSAGEAVIGANVVVKEASGVGTITDVDGMFQLSVPTNGATLVFSYTGYETQEVAIGASNTVNVSLSEGQLLQEVVVVGLGIDRNSRSVAYANQTVKSDELMALPNKNTLEALRGKTAGVKITTGSGSVGASSKVVLRAEASLTGNNNALIVVDGVPIDNNSAVGGLGSGEGGYSDYGNRFNDVNPDDIESVTVLKGPSATSLYGSRGASGVLLITTKKGLKGKPKITFNTTSSMEKAYVLLKRQDKYGQGLLNPDGSNTFDSGENFSWGPAFDGVSRPWTSPVDADGDGDLEYLSRPYSAVPNQLENFFRTGRTNVNNLSVSGGKEGFTYYASFANTNQKGILENTNYNRNNVTLRATAELSEKLSSEFGVSYATVKQNTAQEGSRAFEGQNPYASAIQAPVNIPYNELRDYTNPFHSFGGYYGTYTVNPYFILNEYINEGEISNLLGNFSLNYKLLKGLDINTRIGANIVGTDIEQGTPQYAYDNHYVWEDNLHTVQRTDRQQSAGGYLRRNINSKNLDWTTTASYGTNLDAAERWKLNTTIGYNLFDRTTSSTTAETQGGLVVPGVYNLANSLNQTKADQNDTKYRLMGFFGNALVGLDNIFFLEYSARQDYSSTLPVANQSFFYQAFGASAVLSEALNLNDSNLNFLKARVSYGTTGKDAGLYLLQSIYQGNPTAVANGDIYDINFPLNGQTGFSKGSQIGNPNLKPELTTTFEAGLDAGFFNDRLNFEYTYYSSNHDDQIVIVSLPSSSGFGNSPQNVGRITNRGHELSINWEPFSSPTGFRFDVGVTFAKNKNEVVKISDETDELVIFDSGRGVTLVAEKGQPFGTFKGQIALKDPSGNPIVAGGLPVYSAIPGAIGNVQPDWLGGLNTKIGYKNFNLFALFDVRQGGEILSLTKSATEFNGTALSSLINDRKPFVIENSVVEVTDGAGNVTYQPNTVPTLANAFIDDGNYGRNVIDGSFVKFREIGLSYNIPSSFTKSLKISNATIGVFAKNLKFWLPESNTYGDPEVNGPGTAQSNITGIETSQTPPSRSLGFNLNIQF